MAFLQIFVWKCLFEFYIDDIIVCRKYTVVGCLPLILKREEVCENEKKNFYNKSS